LQLEASSREKVKKYVEKAMAGEIEREGEDKHEYTITLSSRRLMEVDSVEASSPIKC
jgi:hypothetical protein